MTTTNSNCLAGISCPQCGYADTLNITATTWFEYDDMGLSDHGDVEWNDDSVCSCPQCGYTATVSVFSGAPAIDLSKEALPPRIVLAPAMRDWRYGDCSSEDPETELSADQRKPWKVVAEVSDPDGKSGVDLLFTRPDGKVISMSFEVDLGNLRLHYRGIDKDECAAHLTFMPDDVFTECSHNAGRGGPIGSIVGEDRLSLYTNPEKDGPRPSLVGNSE